MNPTPADRFQVALRNELAHCSCPLPAPLDTAGGIIFPRAYRGRAALVKWRQGSPDTEWAAALRQPHGFCLEIPEHILLLDLDKPGVLELLQCKLPAGYGLVSSSPGKFHIWLNGTAPAGNHIGTIGGIELEVAGRGKLATLPPSLHLGTGRAYRWLQPFLGTVPTCPEDLGIIINVPTAVQRVRPGHFPISHAGDIPLHELMERYVGQAGRRQGSEWAFRCPKHEDKHPSLMVSDEKEVFLCFSAGCRFRGNRLTLQELLGLRQPRHKGVKVIAEVTLQ
jgi:hypothetical protein